MRDQNKNKKTGMFLHIAIVKKNVKSLENAGRQLKAFMTESCTDKTLRVRYGHHLHNSLNFICMYMLCAKMKRGLQNR